MKQMAAEVMAGKKKNEKAKGEDSTALVYRGQLGSLGAIRHFLSHHYELLIRKLPFQRLVREIAEDEVRDRGSDRFPGGIKFQSVCDNGSTGVSQSLLGGIVRGHKPGSNTHEEGNYNAQRHYIGKEN